MTSRVDLEEWKTPEEMAQLIENAFHESRALSLARREGFVKDIAEEYEPLWRLIRHWPAPTTARLAPKAHGGPDAYVRLKVRDLSVQITLAGASEQTFLNRLAALGGRPYFPAQTKQRIRGQYQVRSSGRALQAPAGLIRSNADAIIRAIEEKRLDFSKTDLLLVAIDEYVPRRFRKAIKRATRARMSSLSPSPYGLICAVVGDLSFVLKPGRRAKS
jgi:hypothetical protein